MTDTTFIQAIEQATALSGSPNKKLARVKFHRPLTAADLADVRLHMPHGELYGPTLYVQWLHDKGQVVFSFDPEGDDEGKLEPVNETYEQAHEMGAELDYYAMLETAVVTLVDKLNKELEPAPTDDSDKVVATFGMGVPPRLKVQERKRQQELDNAHALALQMNALWDAFEKAGYREAVWDAAWAENHRRDAERRAIENAKAAAKAAAKAKSKAKAEAKEKALNDKPPVIEPYTFAKGMVKAICPSHDPKLKTRAARLAEFVGGKWTIRAGGYVMSPKQAERLQKLYNDGVDAHLMTS